MCQQVVLNPVTALSGVADKKGLAETGCPEDLASALGRLTLEPPGRQAETWEELRANVLEAVSLHFENNSAQGRFRTTSGWARPEPIADGDWD